MSEEEKQRRVRMMEAYIDMITFNLKTYGKAFPDEPLKIDDSEKIFNIK